MKKSQHTFKAKIDELMHLWEKALECGGMKKDIVLLILAGISLIFSLFHPLELPFDPAWIAIVLCGIPILSEAVIGLVTAFDIKADVYYAELDFDTLVWITRNHSVTVSELSKYPEVRRDLALLVDKEVTFSRLYSIARSTEKKLLRSVSLFDVYEGDKLPEGKKSYALSFILEDTTKTLTDSAIDRAMSNLIRAFEQHAGAEIRS